MIGNILTYAVGSLFWGLLIALACIGLYLFLIKGWYRNAFLKPISYVIAVVLGLILTYNCTIVCGAVAMKTDIDHYESLIGETLKTSFSDYDNVVDQTMSNEIVLQVVKEYPILYFYFDSVNFEGRKLSELPHMIADTLRSYLNNVIIKNLLWAVAFLAIGTFVTIKTIGRNESSLRNRGQCQLRNRERVFSPRRRIAVNRRSR